MQVQGILGIENSVVAALYHAGASALADEPLGYQGDFQLRVPLIGVEGTEETRTATTEDKYVYFEVLHPAELPKISPGRWPSAAAART